MPSLKRFLDAHPLYVFGLTWFGQLISIVGSSLTSFAVGVEVFQSTGSTTQFSLLSFFFFFPILALSPFAGALIDRWDRRLVMLFSDLGGGLGSFLIWLLFAANQAGHWHLQSWHYYVPVALSSAAGAFRLPAYQASTTLLVPKRHLGRANGLIELAVGVGQLAAPVLASALLGRIGLQGILMIDLVSFLFAVVTLLIVRFPRPARDTTSEARSNTLWQEVAYGWTFIRTRPGLFGLMLFIGAVNLVVSMVSVLITPLVLCFTDVSSLGLILSTAGLGMLAGGILMSVWGGGRRRMKTVLLFELMAGGVLLVGGVTPTVPLVAIAASAFLFTVPFISGSVLTIWQRKVAPGIQGRVFAVRRMIALVTPPVVTLLAGPLADQLFEPWLAPGGALAGSVGRLIGIGPGRGIGLLFVVMGVFSIGLALVVRLSPRLWNVESELPDSFGDEAPRHVAGQPEPAMAAGEGAAELTPNSGIEP